MSFSDPLDYLPESLKAEYQLVLTRCLKFSTKRSYLLATNRWKRIYSLHSKARRDYKTSFKRLKTSQLALANLMPGKTFSSWPLELRLAYIALYPFSYKAKYRNPKYAQALLHIRRLMKRKARLESEREYLREYLKLNNKAEQQARQLKIKPPR